MSPKSSKRRRAGALGVPEAYLSMMRKNAETFPGLNLKGFDVDRIAPFSRTVTAAATRNLVTQVY